MKTLTSKQSQALYIAVNGGAGGAHFCLPEQKTTVRQLAKKGLVTVTVATTRTAGFIDWWVAATPAGLAVHQSAYAKVSA